MSIQVCSISVFGHQSVMYVSVFRGRSLQRECGGYHRRAVGRCCRSRVRLQQTAASLLHPSDSCTSAEGSMGSRHGDVRVFLLGRLHPAGQADL